MSTQEIVAFGIVAIAFITIGIKGFRRYLAQPVSELLLKKGHVKAAMWFRKWLSNSSGCSKCPSQKDS